MYKNFINVGKIVAIDVYYKSKCDEYEYKKVKSLCFPLIFKKSYKWIEQNYPYNIFNNIAEILDYNGDLLFDNEMGILCYKPSILLRTSDGRKHRKVFDYDAEMVEFLDDIKKRLGDKLIIINEIK